MKNILPQTLAVMALASASLFAGVAPAAKAGPGGSTVGCATDIAKRGFLGLDAQHRTICDSPRRADGSWDRERYYWYPAYYRKPSSSCSYSTYSSRCTYDEGGYVDDKTIEGPDYYPVSDGTVLPEEPGYVPR